MDCRRTVIFNFAVVERVGVNPISDLLGLGPGTDNLNLSELLGNGSQFASK
jgi:hypothetical protein